MKWLNSISSNTLLKLLLLVVSTIFIPYIFLCFYAHPIADDYTFRPSSSFWETQRWIYSYWNGRYTANFMVLTDPILFGSLVGYHFAALLLLIFIPFSIFFMLSAVIGNGLAPLQKISISLIISGFILSLLPSLPEGIYWYTGSVTYIAGCILAMFYIGIMVMYLQKNFIISPLVHLILCIVLLGLAIGFNEVQMFLLLIAHLFIWLNLKKEEKFNSFWLILVFSCLIFSSIVFFSPGNSYRAAYYSNNHRLFNSLFMTLLQMLRFFFSWVCSAPILIGSILFAPISLQLNKHSALLQKLSRNKPIIFFVLLWGILFTCIFLPYWTTAILGQHRTLNTACFFFVFIWFLFLHSIYARNGAAEKITELLNRPAQIGLTLLLVASLLFSGNCSVALMDIGTGKITGFDKEWNQRDSLIALAKKQGLSQVTFSALENKPGSLFVLDIKPDCNHWINKQYASFYGLKKVCMDSIQAKNTNNP